MIYVLIEEFGVILLLLGLATCIYLIIQHLYKKKIENNTVRTLQDAVNQQRKKNHRLNKDSDVQIEDLINSYIQMVAKHGVESNEAKAVLFGLTNPTVQVLYGEFLQEFQHRVEIINKTYEEIKKN